VHENGFTALFLHQQRLINRNECENPFETCLFECVYSLCPFPLAARAINRENSNKLLSGRTTPLFLPEHRSIWFPAQHHQMANSARRHTGGSKLIAFLIARAPQKNRMFIV
jgi:hypothetical protein